MSPLPGAPAPSQPADAAAASQPTSPGPLPQPADAAAASQPTSPGPLPTSRGPVVGRTSPRPPFPGTEKLNAAVIFGSPGYQAPHVGPPAVAVAALILGLASVIPGVGVIAAVVGAVAVRRLRSSFSSSLSMGWFGMVAGLASTVFWVWLWLILRAGGL